MISSKSTTNGFPNSNDSSGEKVPKMTKSNQQSIIFVSETGDETISVYNIGSNGALSLRSTNPAYGPSGALCLHPKLEILYDAHVESTTISSFKIDRATGNLSHQNQVNTGIDITCLLYTSDSADE